MTRLFCVPVYQQKYGATNHGKQKACKKSSSIGSKKERKKTCSEETGNEKICSGKKTGEASRDKKTDGESFCREIIHKNGEASCEIGCKRYIQAPDNPCDEETFTPYGQKTCCKNPRET